MRPTWLLLKTAFADFFEDRAPRMGAALAYYTLFSLAPLLIVAVAIGGAVFGEQAAEGKIRQELEGMLGPNSAAAIEDVVHRTANRPEQGIAATLVGIAVMFFGATNAFAALKESLNTIWGVDRRPGGAIRIFVVDRLWSFAMAAAIGFLLLVSLLFSALVGATSQWLSEWLPIPPNSIFALDWGVMFVLTTVLFAALFKYLPDVRIAWADVWFGAIITAILFTVGKALIGLYLGRAAIASAYGAAGSLVVVLIWTYFSAQIFLFGAELTQAKAKLFARKVESGKRKVESRRD